MPLTTLVPFATIKALLGISTGSAYTDTPALDVLQTSLSRLFDDYLYRTLAEGTYTETIFSRQAPTQIIPLRALPITSVTSVTVGGVATTAYVITSHGLRLAGSVRLQDVVVSYIGGYSDASIPTTIKKAALLQLAYEYKKLPHIGATSVTTDGGTVNSPELALLKEVRRLLAPYRHPAKICP